jgi:predicted transposase/invertase (TIGR01784 family)
MLFQQLKKGDEHFELKKVVSIVIADFTIIEDSLKYHHKFQLNDMEAKVKFTDIVEIHSLELQKIPENSDNTAKYDWVQFLSSESEEEFDMLAAKNPAIEKAVVELKRLSQDEETQKVYDDRIKAIRDRNSQIKTAVNKAKKEFEVREQELVSEIKNKDDELSRLRAELEQLKKKS